MTTTTETTETETRLYSPKEVSESGRLPFCERVLVRMATNGEIQHVRMGRKIRFRDKDIEDYIAKNVVKVRKAEAAPRRNPKRSYAK